MSRVTTSIRRFLVVLFLFLPFDCSLFFHTQFRVPTRKSGLCRVTSTAQCSYHVRQFQHCDKYQIIVLPSNLTMHVTRDSSLLTEEIRECIQKFPD